MLKKTVFIVSLILLFVCVFILNTAKVKLIGIEQLNNLYLNSITNFVISLAVTLIALFAFKGKLHFKKIKSFAWLILPFFVAIVNFPFNAIISKNAMIIYPKYIPLLLFNCLCIGISEELLFRIIINYLIKEKIPKNKDFLKYVIITSAIFSLSHLLNLITGANVFQTLLQVIYTFLLGSMLTITYDKTNNIWICVIIHAVFDFGGNIITYLGKGSFQDATFWVLTVIVGIACAVEMIRYIYLKMKNNDL